MKQIITALLIALCITRLDAAPPNVIVFLSDDQGWGDLSLNGNTNLSTPNIDSIAHDGARLERFYVCPVCSPTRAEFLTGRYHPRTGVRGVSTGQERLNVDEKTIADAFKAAGYATGAFGKWHNGSQWPYHPNARGFDEYHGFTSGHWGEYFDPPLEHNGQPVRGKGYVADIFTERAMEFIAQNKEKPFLCYIPYNTPHSPWAAPEEYWKRFKDKQLAMRAADPSKEVLDETRVVLAMCENLDWNVGRVLKQLDALMLRDNTIVVWFHDNGPNTVRWTGGMKGKKGGTDEGGVRSPCLLRWPAGISAGTTVTQITGAIDLMPTLTALAGIKRVGEKPLDGHDLSPLLKGAKAQWPARTIFSTWGGNVSARTDTHRLDNTGALFDMKSDPGQTTDIAAKQPEIASQLTAAVAAWRKEVLGEGAAIAKGKGKNKGMGGNAVDPRPISVGYAEFPRTTLPARDGTPGGDVRRSSNAPNCSYFLNWTSKDDSITWNVEAHRAGEYEVEVFYTCPDADAGALIELSHGASRLTGKVAPGWDPPLYTNQDTINRPPAESQMKEFRVLKFGVIRLEKTTAPLTLRALEIPGSSVMDVRSVVLTRKGE